MPDPDNPYRPRDQASDGPIRGDLSRIARNNPYHPEAGGLTGEMLDGMLKAAKTEGVDIGRREATEELVSRLNAEREGIWDGGYEAGRKRVQDDTGSSHHRAIQLLLDLSQNKRLAVGLRKDCADRAEALMRTWDQAYQ